MGAVWLDAFLLHSKGIDSDLWTSLNDHVYAMRLKLLINSFITTSLEWPASEVDCDDHVTLPINA